MSEGVRLYAGTQHGLIIWRSTNGGWEQVARHFEDGIIDSIFGCKQSPERVFVGVTHDGLYRTVNGGKSWVKILDGATSARLPLIPRTTGSSIRGSSPSRSIGARTGAIIGKSSKRSKNFLKRCAKTGGSRSRLT
jgi:hypothetical protein